MFSTVLTILDLSPVSLGDSLKYFHSLQILWNINRKLPTRSCYGSPHLSHWAAKQSCIPGLVFNLGATTAPPPQFPLAKSVIKPQEGQNAPFSPSWTVFFFGRGGGSKLSSMMATLKTIEWNSTPPPPPHPPEKKSIYFVQFCPKTAPHKVENGKEHSLDIHGIRPLREQTMRTDSRLQKRQFFPRIRCTSNCWFNLFTGERTRWATYKQESFNNNIH